MPTSVIVLDQNNLTISSSLYSLNTIQLVGSQITYFRILLMTNPNETCLEQTNTYSFSLFSYADANSTYVMEY